MSEQKKILLVEDEAFIALAIEAEFRQSGFVIEAAANHKQAMRSFQDLDPDIVVLDYYLACNETSLEIARNIRELKDIPIVFTSANDNISDMLKDENLSNVYFLSKPVTPEDIIELLQTL